MSERTHNTPVFGLGVLAGLVLGNKQKEPKNPEAGAIEPEEASKPPRPARRWRRLGSIGLAFALSAGATVKAYDAYEESKQRAAEQDRLTNIIANITEVSPDTVRGKGTKVSKLPGYGIRINGETSNKLAASSLLLTEQYKLLKDSPGSRWSPVCTATKVHDNEHSLILTAAHCMSSATHGQKGGLRPSFSPTKSQYEYAVFQPGAALDTPPLAVVDSIAIEGLGRSDYALLQPLSTPEFDNVPSLPLQDIIDHQSLPLPGQEVALHSLPGSSSNQRVSTIGHYLGRITDERLDNPGDVLGYVAIPKDVPPSQDPCNFGGSGSLGILPDGQLLGPLSSRVNTGYGDGFVQAGDPQKFSQLNRLLIEDGLDLNVDDWGTLCAYSAQEEDTIPNLLHVLDDPNYQFPPVSMK